MSGVKSSKFAFSVKSEKISSSVTLAQVKAFKVEGVPVALRGHYKTFHRSIFDIKFFFYR